MHFCCFKQKWDFTYILRYNLLYFMDVLLDPCVKMSFIFLMAMQHSTLWLYQTLFSHLPDHWALRLVPVIFFLTTICCNRHA